MTAPSAKDQLRFLTNLQRLLAEGSFVATYKYALLLALAEIAIEHGGEDDGAALPVSTKLIADKFIQFYWRQCLPYVPRGGSLSTGLVLRQNTGRQAAILGSIIQARNKYAGSLVRAPGRGGSANSDMYRNSLVIPGVIRRSVGSGSASPAPGRRNTRLSQAAGCQRDLERSAAVPGRPPRRRLERMAGGAAGAGDADIRRTPQQPALIIAAAASVAS